MRDVSPNTSVIRVTGEFGGFTPQELFDHWIEPELLVKWWPREAKVDPRVDGEYEFSWPEQNWVLHGKYTAFEPAKHLGFTWAWNFDHNENTPLQVDMSFVENDEGTTLTIDHSRWEDSPEAQSERQGVLEGWIHFGMRLAGLRQGDST